MATKRPRSPPTLWSPAGGRSSDGVSPVPLSPGAACGAGRGITPPSPQPPKTPPLHPTHDEDEHTRMLKSTLVAAAKSDLLHPDISVDMTAAKTSPQHVVRWLADHTQNPPEVSTAFAAFNKTLSERDGSAIDQPVTAIRLVVALRTHMPDSATRRRIESMHGGIGYFDMRAEIQDLLQPPDSFIRKAIEDADYIKVLGCKILELDMTAVTTLDGWRKSDLTTGGNVIRAISGLRRTGEVLSNAQTVLWAYVVSGSQDHFFSKTRRWVVVDSRFRNNEHHGLLTDAANDHSPEFIIPMYRSVIDYSLTHPEDSQYHLVMARMAQVLRNDPMYAIPLDNLPGAAERFGELKARCPTLCLADVLRRQSFTLPDATDGEVPIIPIDKFHIECNVPLIAGGAARWVAFGSTKVAPAVSFNDIDIFTYSTQGAIEIVVQCGGTIDNTMATFTPDTLGMHPLQVVTVDSPIRTLQRFDHDYAKVAIASCIRDGSQQWFIVTTHCGLVANLRQQCDVHILSPSGVSIKEPLFPRHVMISYLKSLGWREDMITENNLCLRIIERLRKARAKGFTLSPGQQRKVRNGGASAGDGSGSDDESKGTESDMRIVELDSSGVACITLGDGSALAEFVETSEAMMAETLAAETALAAESESDADV